MPAAQPISQCGSVTALSLGLPSSAAIPAAKGTLPKQMFTAKTPVSAKLKQRFANDIDSITMLALLRPSTIGVAANPDGKGVGEIMVLGIRHRGTSAPIEVIEHIAAMRRSGIIFVCVRDGVTADATDTAQQQAQPSHNDSSSRKSLAAEQAAQATPVAQGESCAFAVRRALPGRPGHPQLSKVFAGDYRPAGEARLIISGETLDDVWNSLNAQIILGSSNAENIDARIATRDRFAALRADETKLAKDHARAKQPAQRNEIYAKLHKVRVELSHLAVEQQ
ncbi:MAG: DUF4391 domain-containing protein [Bifidobacterium sp.]|jgi:hypothetical protein|nr:DUF4391 domain-containing protein [Bifidobacterium sp.]